ncbi:MAG: DUF7133 domain-containing protein [Verrucomicrobiales bacterium]
MSGHLLDQARQHGCGKKGRGYPACGEAPVMHRHEQDARVPFTSFLAFLFAVIPLVTVETSPAAGFRDFYEIENIPMPEGVDAQIGGIDVLPDGRVAACLHRGEVLFGDPAGREWQCFASGLHEPLGIIAPNDREVLVMQRAELTRLRDTDKDGKADRYETLWDNFGMTGNYHEYAYGPVRDARGDLFVSLNLASTGDGVHKEVRGAWSPLGPTHADFFDDWEVAKNRVWKMYSRVPWRGWVIKLDGRTFAPTPWSCGFRSPDGLGFDGQGRLFVSDNQGDWVGTSCLFMTAQNDFHGHPISLVWRDGWRDDPMTRAVAEFDALRARPVVLFPHGLMANSPTQPVCDTTGGKFGPFSGQLFIGEMNTPRLIRVMLDEVAGEVQGACVPFVDGAGLRAGNHRLVFGPDGRLWVGQTHLAWAGGEGLQRLSWKGRVPFDVLTVRLQPQGFLFNFTSALDVSSFPPVEAWTIRRYRYEYHSSYGSPQIGLTKIAPARVTLQNEGKTVWLELGEIQSGGVVYEFTLPALRAAAGTSLVNRLVCYTVNRTL